MNGVEVVRDGFSRVSEVVNGVMLDITDGELYARLDPDANSIGWLIWHLARVQDDHVSGVAGKQQVWFEKGWCEGFSLSLERRSIGYGHTSEQVRQVSGIPADLLQRYFDDVHAATNEFLSTLEDHDLDRVIDASWDPPVTMGIRLISVISDDLQHGGQAALIRGILSRTEAREGT